jgi:Cof subfamily protein (haloacid dehalogenase superfamily)
MSRIALVVSDVDGTLVTPEKRLTEKSRLAAERLAARGIAFSIASSRPPFGLRMLVEPLRLRLPIAAFNGALLVGPDLAPLERRLLPRAVAHDALAFFRARGIDTWVFTSERWLLNNPDGAYVPLERRTIAAEPMVVDEFDAALDEVGKIVGVSAAHEALAAAEEPLRGVLAGRAVVARSQSYYLDVTPDSADKGAAVATLQRRLGIPAEATAVIGDGENDIAMFAAAGFAIAMGNAAASVKARADAVAAANTEDGFADAVERLILPRAG